jgi:hypothetical protein
MDLQRIGSARSALTRGVPQLELNFEDLLSRGAKV